MNAQELSEQNRSFLDEQDPLKSAKAIIAWAHKKYGAKLTIASSFSKEDIVLIDLAHEVSKDVRVFTLDTGRLHEETYEVTRKVRERFDIHIETYAPETSSLENLVRIKGTHSFRDSIEARKECCNIRKVAPLQRALQNASAWATGLRRSQSVTRDSLLPLEYDVANGRYKFSPLYLWNDDDIDAHIASKELPYNILHDQGFASIGCAPCTRAIKPGEDARAGRWWWESPEQKECGLHARAS